MVIAIYTCSYVHGLMFVFIRTLINVRVRWNMTCPVFIRTWIIARVHKNMDSSFYYYVYFRLTNLLLI